MNTAILSSTLLLTLLLSVGLFFFIRASVKDRIQEVKLISETEDSLMLQLQQYFQQRSYRVTKVDPQQHLVTFEGFVRPSTFLAIFLTLLAGAGITSLALVLSLLFPSLNGTFLWLVLLSPAAGAFYWKKSARPEQVALKVEQLDSDKPQPQSQITIIAHRDELIELQKVLQLKPQ